MPNKENIRKLVEALRSGEYQQAKDKLTVVRGNVETHCCLGVACRVAMADGVAVNLLPRGMGIGLHISYDGSSTFMPDSVAAYYEFASPSQEGWMNPLLIGKDGYRHTATVLNDDLGYTFMEIADAFERTYLTEETNGISETEETNAE